jgi:hypothetical protein
MLKLFSFYSLILPAMLFSQNKFSISAQEGKISFSSDSLYIICRGTKSKAGVIAKQFNIIDSVVTHVGIGYIDEGVLKIVNVTNEPTTTSSALIFDSYLSYTSSSDVFFVGIWRAELNSMEYLKMKRIIDSISNKKIIFDYSFLLTNNDTLYCSEFCANILMYVNKNKFYFPPTILDIKDPLLRVFLKRDRLIYFPVDFFKKNKLFEPMISYYKNM